MKKIRFLSLLILSCALLWQRPSNAQVSFVAQSCDSLAVDLVAGGCPTTIQFPVSVSQAIGTALGTDVVLSNVQVVIEHTWNEDIDLFLESPSGAQVTLTSGNGGSDDNFGDTANCHTQVTTFTMDAGTAISAGTSPYIGSFIPDGDFSVFDGEDPNGTWIFHICDQVTADNGSVHFLSLTFDQPPTCPTPSAVGTSNITTSSADISYSGGLSGHDWFIEYGPAGFTPGTGMTQINYAGGPTNTATISGLSQDTDYEYYVWQVCNVGDTSIIVGPNSFSTLVSCPQPTNLSASNLTTSSADLPPNRVAI